MQTSARNAVSRSAPSELMRSFLSGLFTNDGKTLNNANTATPQTGNQTLLLHSIAEKILAAMKRVRITILVGVFFVICPLPHSHF